MNITPFELAQRFVGVKEISGTLDNPQILAMLWLDQRWPDHDEVPWCSAFVNYVCWLLRLPRTKSLRARSWLEIGTPIPLHTARAGFDVVVLKRGDNVELGHVGFFAGTETGVVFVLGGNQGDSVSVVQFPSSDVVGVRRLA